MSDPTRPGPEAMRAALAGYVQAVHAAYLDSSVLLPPAERARLPLLDPAPLTVIAVGTAYLHVVGTRETLPAPTGQEVALDDELDGLALDPALRRPRGAAGRRPARRVRRPGPRRRYAGCSGCARTSTTSRWPPAAA